MLDILFLNVPLMSLGYPAAGTALLAGTCKRNGFSANVIDLNYTLFEQHGQDVYDSIAEYLTLSGDIAGDVEYLYRAFLASTVNQIQNLQPRYLGISVFTFECQKFTQDLCQSLRDTGYTGDIFLGGAGLSTTGIANKIADFGEHMVSQGLVNHYIRGEGDEIILDILRNGFPEDRGKVYKITNIDRIELPDYTSVINNNYHWPGNTPTLPITGSRGCVRACTFCDIHKFWPRFEYRRGASVAQEMIEMHAATGVRNFIFMDSLINGSIKSFREMCRHLVDHYRMNNLPDAYFTWGGQFICRGSRQFKESDFELAAQAGMTGVAIGVETGSDSVRAHMRKGFTNEDLDFTLRCLSRYRLNCYFLMIVGYPTETWQDFLDTVHMFERYEPYCRDGTILGVNLGGTLSLDAGTDLVERANELALHNVSHTHEAVFGIDWISDKNPDLDLHERITRRILLQERLMDLNYSIWNGDHQLKRLIAAWERVQNGKY